MKIKIEGMMCSGCVNRVTNTLLNLGLKNVFVSLDKKEADFAGDICEKDVKEAIESLGFEYISGEGFIK